MDLLKTIAHINKEFACFDDYTCFAIQVEQNPDYGDDYVDVTVNHLVYQYDELVEHPHNEVLAVTFHLKIVNDRIESFDFSEHGYEITTEPWQGAEGIWRCMAFTNECKLSRLLEYGFLSEGF